jgi:P22 coat protein - gene protein 5
MPNQYVFPDWVAEEALRILLNMLEVSQYFNTEYNKEFDREFPIGEVVRVKLPQRFLIRDGLGYTPQPINRINTTVACNQIFGVDFEFDDFEAALLMERSKEEISEQYLKPAMAQIAQEIDTRAALFAYQNANNIVGVLGTDPNSATTFMQARQRLKNLAGNTRGSDNGMIVPSQVYTALVPVLQALFNPSDEISEQYKEGSLGRLWNFDWYESESLFRHVAGTWAAAVTMTAAGVGGTTLTITATAGDTFNVGDVISIANVNQVNPMTRRFLAAIPKTFVVTAPLTAAGGGADVLNISPAIFGPGSQYQNVDALPAAGAALTLFPGTAAPNGKSGAQGLWINKDAFALVGVKLQSPKATELTAQARDKKTGIPIRFVRMYDPIQKKMTNSWDTCIGFGQLYADSCAGRILCA